jgi:hypothetical protein
MVVVLAELVRQRQLQPGVEGLVLGITEEVEGRVPLARIFLVQEVVVVRHLLLVALLRPQL